MRTTCSNCKDEYNRSNKKFCVCGGHNISNIKKNKNHNSTKQKLNIKKTKKFISKKLKSVE